MQGNVRPFRPDAKENKTRAIARRRYRQAQTEADIGPFSPIRRAVHPRRSRKRRSRRRQTWGRRPVQSLQSSVSGRPGCWKHRGSGREHHGSKRMPRRRGSTGTRLDVQDRVSNHEIQSSRSLVTRKNLEKRTSAGLPSPIRPFTVAAATRQSRRSTCPDLPWSVGGGISGASTWLPSCSLRLREWPDA